MKNFNDDYYAGFDIGTDSVGYVWVFGENRKNRKKPLKKVKNLKMLKTSRFLGVKRNYTLKKQLVFLFSAKTKKPG